MECEVFLAAERAQSSNDFAAAVAHYQEYQQTYPAGLLLTASRQNLAETHLAWGAQLRQQGQSSQAIEQYAVVLRDYGDSAAAEQAVQGLTALYDTAIAPLGQGNSCGVVPILDSFFSLPGEQAAPIVTSAQGVMPQALYECGVEEHNSGDHLGAIEHLQRLTDTYPTSPLVGQAEPTLIAAKVANIKQGSTGELPPPQAVGSAPSGSVIVEIINDSPDTLEVLVSGPNARAETVPPCPTCSYYPSFLGPSSCAPASKPTISVRLPPGTYDVVVQSISDGSVTPYSGTWSLESGTEYSNCFFVVTSFG
ncbi:MAG: hypothetical protein ACRDZO_18730 [Egibacteraceae bacterium]